MSIIQTPFLYGEWEPVSPSVIELSEPVMTLEEGQRRIEATGETARAALERLALQAWVKGETLPKLEREYAPEATNDERRAIKAWVEGRDVWER